MTYDFRIRMATDEERRETFTIASDAVAVVELDGEMIALGDDYGTAHLPDGEGGFMFGRHVRDGDGAALADAVEALLVAAGDVYTAKMP